MIIVKFIGLPGCGKTSTIQQLLKEKLNATLKSDVILGKTDLSSMYINPEQNTIVYHIKLLDEFEKVYNEKPLRKFDYVIEHTPFEMFEFFSLANLQSGNITYYGYDYLKDKSMKIKLNQYIEHETEKCVYIYIIAQPDVCLQNIKQRNREGELNINPQIFETIYWFIMLHLDNNYNRKLIINYEHNDFNVENILSFLQSL